MIAGVGKEAPTAVNELGGKQSSSPYRCDLLPPHACLAVAEVLKHGADKYGDSNWHKIPVHDHIIVGRGRYVSFAEAGLL